MQAAIAGVMMLAAISAGLGVSSSIPDVPPPAPCDYLPPPPVNPCPQLRPNQPPTLVLKCQMGKVA